MEESQGTLPLSTCHVQIGLLIINRLHMLLHSTALSFLFYYRLRFLFQDPETRGSHLLPWFLVFASEIILSFIWFLGQAYRWRPVSRTVFPERLPEDDKLPGVDVFICTADPIKEPTLEVMNTVLSSMALDYPQEKLHVYLSDDGCSPMTLYGMRKAYEFARWWLPFCRRYKIKNRCPKAYFSALENDDSDFARSSVYMEDKQKIKGKYEAFKEEIETFRKDGAFFRDSVTVGDYSSVIEVMNKNVVDDVDNVKMPFLVYVSRERKLSSHHHFKAGALNVLLRVSAVMSNSPYILVLDCDMFCNDPTSARYAMCFHLDPKISSSLAFVQFPQKFHNISKNDIYDSQLRSIFTIQWQGMDGLKGPVMSGTCFYIKRVSLYGNRTNEGGTDMQKLQEYFGSSNEFIKSLAQNYTSGFLSGRNTLLQEPHLLASCRYEIGTKWGQDIGFLYDSVVEDFLTGFILHCNGWTSVFCEPSRPQFLGTATTNLNAVLIQGTRWYSGLFENGISKVCPLIYGPLRMPLLQSLCFAELTYFPLYCLPLWCFATIPQLCLLNGIPLYPKVSDRYFIIFLFIFLSSLSKHLLEVFVTGGTLHKWINELRIWMMKSTTCDLYGCLDALMKKVGIREASFLPTNKAEDDEQTLLYQIDKYDFRASNIFIVPMIAIITINICCLVVGVYRVIFVGDWDKMLIQIVLASFIITVNYPIIEGLVIRKDKGRISQLVAIHVIFVTMTLLTFCKFI
ncbi:cellulose synthase-like protein G2 isoform X1 [Trifolium pratense]|uniref:cellulose synthase-like protein G2 isoform X1 n=1 Tax=Trifolium pratense TaxID=57577 RepID=UPI001E6948F9|nr:cellulose synthase-like protein G2 isoform X1 [Trifolium pratense]